jgi:hypothetical protein
MSISRTELGPEVTDDLLAALRGGLAWLTTPRAEGPRKAKLSLAGTGGQTSASKSARLIPCVIYEGSGVSLRLLASPWDSSYSASTALCP